MVGYFKGQLYFFNLNVSTAYFGDTLIIRTMTNVHSSLITFLYYKVCDTNIYDDDHWINHVT